MPLKTDSMRLRVSPAEKQAWGQAAGGSGKISEWLRALANEAAHDNASPLRGADRAPAAEQDASLVAGEGSKGIPDIRRVASKQCPRWMHHRAGTYCSSCGTVPTK